jgi:penicillin amidase
MSRALRWAGLVLAVAFGVALGLAVLSGIRLFRLPAASGALLVEGLSAPVHIVRDTGGVPHVDAARIDDAWVGLGFAHAQDRLWQMELLRRSARGTLSELFGSKTLEADRLARTLGLARAAGREAERLDRRTRAALLAYGRGVNAWIAEIRERRAPLPLEFTWLGIKPERWEPADTLAIVRLRSWMLGRSLGASLLLDRLVREVGGVVSERFFPRPPSKQTLEDVVRTSRELGRVADQWAAVTGLKGRVGSLGFVVGREGSTSSQPILANDPHVEFQLPSVFYLAHLRTPTVNVAGATWPGVPVFWTGTTRHTAWGQVALHVNVSELFEETLHPSDPHRYDIAGRWAQADRQEEVIRVRGQGEERIEVLTTRHGPLLVSVLPGDEVARKLALHWTGQHPRSGLRALLALPRAQTFELFRASLRELPAPPTLFLYADRTGAIALQMAGHLPIRPIDTGLLPVPGRSRWYDWRGTLPFEELPHRTEADADWLVAGPRADGLTFPENVTWLWSDSGVTERVNERLRAAKKLGLEEVLALQRETQNASAPRAIRKLLAGVKPRSVAARRVYEILKGWQGATASDASGPAVYHTFRMRLLGQLLRRHLPPAEIDALLSLAEPVPGLALARYLEEAPDRPDQATVQTALEETWSWLSSEVSSNPAKWVWGQTHRLQLSHAFERLGSRLTQVAGRALSPGAFGVPGDPGSVWVMHAEGRDPFRPRVGPAFRFAVDLADPDHSRFGLCGGQSGLPGAARYVDGVSDWVRGKPRILWMHPADVAYHAGGTWELRPGSP